MIRTWSSAMIHSTIASIKVSREYARVGSVGSSRAAWRPPFALRYSSTRSWKVFATIGILNWSQPSTHDSKCSLQRWVRKTVVPVLRPYVWTMKAGWTACFCLDKHYRMVLIVYGDEMMHLQNRQTCFPLSSFLKNDHTSLALSFLTSLTWRCSWCCERKGLCLPARGVFRVWVTTPVALGVHWVGRVCACGARWLGVTFTWLVRRLGASIVGRLCQFPSSPSSSDWDGLGEGNVSAPTDRGVLGKSKRTFAATGWGVAIKNGSSSSMCTRAGLKRGWSVMIVNRR